MRSSTISFSEGFISVSSILTAFISPFPESLTAEAAARGALHLELVELGLHRFHLGLELSGLLHQAQEISHCFVLLRRAPDRLQWRHQSSSSGRTCAPNAEPSSSSGHVPPPRARPSAAAAATPRRPCARPRFRPRKARQHGLYQRIGAHAALELSLPRLVLRSHRTARPAPPTPPPSSAGWSIVACARDR